jgi:regulator of ribonuclease activity A
MDSVKTADLWDRYENRLQVAEPVFNNFGGREAFSGEAVCVRVFEDNVLVKQMLQTEGRGKVLVVDGGGSLQCALIGDIIAGMAVKNNWSGLVVNGCIRDSKEIALLPIGVKALNTNPRKSRKEGSGAIGQPLSFAGVRILPGNVIYADADGLLVAEENLEP